MSWEGDAYCRLRAVCMTPSITTAHIQLVQDDAEHVEQQAGRRAGGRSS